MHSKAERYCRVCGLDHGEREVRDEYGCPTYNICDCCGVEFGYGDETVENCIAIRKLWIEQGMKWHDGKQKPDNWDPEQQFNSILTELR